MSSACLPGWLLVGAGNIGTLAAHHLLAAHHDVQVLDQTRHTRDKTLTFYDGREPRHLRLACRQAASIQHPIRYLAVACKTPFTADAIRHLPMAAEVTVLRLQNGIGSLDGLLPTGARCIEAVTTSAVKGRDPLHEVVAENQTWMGGTPTPPDWFAALATRWPDLAWSGDIRHRQWQKLVANAAINPLTALYDIANGALLERPDAYTQLVSLVAEADALLNCLDPCWPGDSLARVSAVARATAANTSSMRADVQRGAITEIDSISGWLLRQAHAVGLPMPATAAVVEAIRARSR